MTRNFSTTEATPPSAGTDAREIRADVETLIASPEFACSPRRAKLLRYLIERTLAGEGSQITEYGIALDVFEKPPAFDPRLESVVRTEISRLRQKLKEFYAVRGRADRVIIALPQRSYVPSFTFPTPGPEAATAPEASPAKLNWRPIAMVGFVISAIFVVGFLVWKDRHPSTPQIGSLAVLPFQSFSANHADDYLADGVTEELTNAVAQWKDVRIVARTSASQFKTKGTDIRVIGRKLNADAVLEGSVSKQGDRIRITAQLNRSSDGYQLWSKAYDARSADMMTVQQEIAQSIAGTVRKFGGRVPQSVPPAPTISPEALDFYLRGSYQYSRLTPDSLKKSIELFQAAIQLDPAYARAYLALAGSEYELVTLTSSPPLEGVRRVKASLQKVLELDPHSADAHGALAKLVYDFDWRWPDAEREFQLALEQGARSATRSSYCWALATRGRFQEAYTHCQAAESSDPVGAGPRSALFWVYYLQHKYPEAKGVLRGLLDLNPDSLYAHALLGLIAAIQKDCLESKAQFGLVAGKYKIPVAKIGLAYASACTGERDLAVRYLEEAENTKGFGYTSPYQLAMGYAFLGDKEPAIRYLRKSAADREGQIHYLKFDPVFDTIRSDKRYIELERMVGLDP